MGIVLWIILWIMERHNFGGWKWCKCNYRFQVGHAAVDYYGWDSVLNPIPIKKCQPNRVRANSNRLAHNFGFPCHRSCRRGCPTHARTFTSSVEKKKNQKATNCCIYEITRADGEANRPALCNWGSLLLSKRELDTLRWPSCLVGSYMDRYDTEFLDSFFRPVLRHDWRWSSLTSKCSHQGRIARNATEAALSLGVCWRPRGPSPTPHRRCGVESRPMRKDGIHQKRNFASPVNWLPVSTRSRSLFFPIQFY